MAHVVWRMWRRARGGSATYWHALVHIVEKCEHKSAFPIMKRQVGLSSLANDQVIEHCHQLVRDELNKASSGKGDDDFQAEDLNKAYLYPQKFKSSMGAVNKRALTECTAREVQPPCLKVLDCTLSDERLKDIWE